METKRLSLKELNVKSFITDLSREEKQTVNGEIMNYIESAVIMYHTVEAAETTVKITVSVIQSGANTNCAGATRMINCNATGRTTPCDSMC